MDEENFYSFIDSRLLYLLNQLGLELISVIIVPSRMIL